MMFEFLPEENYIERLNATPDSILRVHGDKVLQIADHGNQETDQPN